MRGQMFDLCDDCKTEGACLTATLTQENGVVLDCVKLCDGCAHDRGFQGSYQRPVAHGLAGGFHWLFPF